MPGHTEKEKAKAKAKAKTGHKTSHNTGRNTGHKSKTASAGAFRKKTRDIRKTKSAKRKT